jgi:hypothetical protein
MSGGEIPENMLHQERDLFEENCDALLYLAQRQSKTKKIIFFHFLHFIVLATIHSLPQQKLPDIKSQYLTINVSTVVDVNHFWAQYIDRETNAQMK